jgi:hypothetical protein
MPRRNRTPRRRSQRRPVVPDRPVNLQEIALGLVKRGEASPRILGQVRAIPAERGPDDAALT